MSSGMRVFQIDHAYISPLVFHKTILSVVIINLWNLLHPWPPVLFDICHIIIMIVSICMGVSDCSFICGYGQLLMAGVNYKTIIMLSGVVHVPGKTYAVEFHYVEHS